MAHMLKGKLAVWKDKKGFGFIKPEDGGDDIFIHITALKTMSRRPNIGDTIFFQVQQEDDGRSKAINAKIEGVDTIADEPADKNSGIHKWLITIGLILALASGGLAAYDNVYNDSQWLDRMLNR